MSISRDTKPSEFTQIKGQLLEFRDRDKILASHAMRSANYLAMLLPPKLSDTPLFNVLLNTLQQHLNTLKEEPEGLWNDIITENDNLSETFNNINSTLGSPATNEKHKKRLAACYWITQHYLELLPILKKLDTNKENPVFTRIESSLAGIFQFLPRQAILANDLLKKVEKDWPTDRIAMQSLHSLNRKYKRLNTLMDLTIDILTGKYTSQTLTNYVHSSNMPIVGIALEASNLPPPTNPELNITVMLETSDNDENLPNDQQWEATLTTLGNSMAQLASPQQERDDRQEEPSLSIDEDEDEEQAPPLQRDTIDIETPRDSLATTFSDFDAQGYAINTEPEEVTQETLAKDAILKLKEKLNDAKTPRPVRGGYFAGHRIFIDNQFKQVPEGEAQIRSAIYAAEKRASTTRHPYHQLMGTVLKIAINAEDNKPLFGLRSKATSAFYKNMLDTLNVDINASLASIKKYIKGHDKSYWGTRFHKRPTTVNKILSVINNNKLQPIDKLKKAILLADTAAQNSNCLRSDNTDYFYYAFTSLLIMQTPQPKAVIQDPQDPPRHRRS